MEKTKEKKNRGSLTVEAILFLIPFMCAFLTLINVARFIQAEMLIHHAITQTAKQISTYSYVMTKTKVSEKMQETNGKSEEFLNSVDNTIGAIKDFTDAAQNAGSFEDLSGVVESGIEAGDALATFFNDPKAIASGAFSIAKAEGRGAGMTAIVGALSENSIKNSISKLSDDPDKFLENVGVVGGLEGLDFSGSEWVSNSEGKANIQIVVTYKMKNILFPDFDFGQYEFCQSASTLIW